MLWGCYCLHVSRIWGECNTVSLIHLFQLKKSALPLTFVSKQSIQLVQLLHLHQQLLQLPSTSKAWKRIGFLSNSKSDTFSTNVFWFDNLPMMHLFSHCRSSSGLWVPDYYRVEHHKCNKFSNTATEDHSGKHQLPLHHQQKHTNLWGQHYHRWNTKFWLISYFTWYYSMQMTESYILTNCLSCMTMCYDCFSCPTTRHDSLSPFPQDCHRTTFVIVLIKNAWFCRQIFLKMLQRSICNDFCVFCAKVVANQYRIAEIIVI